MGYRIVVAQPIEQEIIDDLERLGPVHMNPGPEPLSPEALAAAAAEAEALMAFMTERVDRALLEACHNLKIVAGAFKGFDNIDLAACEERGVAFTYVPDLLTAPTAELALGLMIALARHMRAGDAHVRAGSFTGWRPLLYGGSIIGSTVGVVGAGRVGQALLGLLSGFEGTRLVYDTAPLPADEAAALNATMVDLATLTSRSDFVVLATPLTPETLGMVDARFISAMKPGAYLVNPARGSVVVEAAVAEALASGHLGGYAADVFELEDRSRPDAPSTVHPALLAHERTVFTPHLGSAVIPVRKAIARAAADEIIRRLAQ
ncbi:MAG: NAD(P)-dependent oxidoreductase [Pseudomonadota bacterium]